MQLIGWLLEPLILGLLTTLVAGAPLIRLLRRVKARQIVSLDAPVEHQAKSGTPTMGGLAIIVGIGVAYGAYELRRQHPAGLVIGNASEAAVAVLAALLAFAAIGLADDLLIVRRGRSMGLKAREKLFLQFAAAILWVIWRQRAASGAPLTEPPGAWEVWGLPAVHVLLLVGLSNATNLTDGLDGLLAGVSLPIFAALGFIAWTGIGVNPEYGVMTLCLGAVGALVGYLWYNAHPAQVFMGDTGSLALGAAMAAAAIALRAEWALLIAAAVPLAEAASVVLQVISFQTTGRRIFRMSPLHHHFELSGWPETRIVARFTVVSVLCAAAAVLILAWWG